VTEEETDKDKDIGRHVGIEKQRDRKKRLRNKETQEGRWTDAVSRVRSIYLSISYG